MRVVRDRTGEDGTQVLGGERDERSGGNERASLRKNRKELIDTRREAREKESERGMKSVTKTRAIACTVRKNARNAKVDNRKEGRA